MTTTAENVRTHRQRAKAAVHRPWHRDSGDSAQLEPFGQLSGPSLGNKQVATVPSFPPEFLALRANTVLLDKGGSEAGILASRWTAALIPHACISVGRSNERPS